MLANIAHVCRHCPPKHALQLRAHADMTSERPAKRARNQDDGSEACPFVSGADVASDVLSAGHVWEHDHSALLDGPRSYAEIANGSWATHMLSQAALYQSDLIDTLMDNLHAGVHMTSSYSGIGSDAIAADMFLRAAGREGLPLDGLPGAHAELCGFL